MSYSFQAKSKYQKALDLEEFNAKHPGHANQQSHAGSSANNHPPLPPRRPISRYRDAYPPPNVPDTVGKPARLMQEKPVAMKCEVETKIDIANTKMPASEAEFARELGKGHSYVLSDKNTITVFDSSGSISYHQKTEKINGKEVKYMKKGYKSPDNAHGSYYSMNVDINNFGMTFMGMHRGNIDAITRVVESQSGLDAVTNKK